MGVYHAEIKGLANWGHGNIRRIGLEICRDARAGHKQRAMKEEATS